VIDLYTAEADIIKTAAAPSFFKRSRRVETVTSSSLPVGILPHIDIHHEKIALIPGDMVILVSDGVVEAAPEMDGEEWLPRLLSQLDESDCQVLADHLLAQAAALAKGRIQDDMTVLCLRIDLS
jgi:stage II sporulation protein E